MFRYSGIRRYGIWLLVAVLGVCLIRWWNGRGKPERLIEWEADMKTVRGGQALEYALFGELALKATPVTGGAAKIIGHDPQGKGLIRDQALMADETSLYYLIPQAVKRTWQLCRIPVMGGPSESLCTISDGPETVAHSNIAVVGEQVYWVAPRPENPRLRPLADGEFLIEQSTLRCLLKVMPLRGGPVRTLAKHLSHFTQLIPGKEGVYWFQPKRTPQLYDLCYIRSDWTTPKVLTEGGEPASITEFQGRTYWIRNYYQNQGGMRPTLVRSELACIRPDGSQTYLPTPLRYSPKGVYFAPPLVHHNQLYLWGNIPISERESRLSVFRVRPESNQLERLATLDSNSGVVMLDEDFIYYTATERGMAWLDDGIPRPGTIRLYRIPLPKTAPSKS